MKASKKHKVIREGDPLFEKLKSQMRPDIAKGLSKQTAKHAGIAEIEATIHQGNWRDANFIQRQCRTRETQNE